jgi:hypothetical protein
MDSVLYDIILPPVDAQTSEFETLVEFDLPEASSTPISKRKPAWSDVEQGVLIEEVGKRNSVLFGKFKGPGRGKKEREAAWDCVATAVNGYAINILLKTLSMLLIKEKIENPNVFLFK